MTAHVATRRWLAILTATAMAMTVAVTAGLADTQVGGHEIEGDLAADTDPQGTVDWVPGGSETGIFDGTTETCPEGNAGRPTSVVDEGFSATLICDSVDLPGEEDSNIFEGGAKEDDPLSQTVKSSPVTPKTDLTHAYARGVIDSGDAWVIAAYEVIPKQGSYHTNVEFNQHLRCLPSDDIVDDATGCAVGEQTVPFRTPGDVLLAVDIGGSNDPDKKIRLLGFIAFDDDADPSTDAVYNFGKNAAETLANADFSVTGDGSIDDPNIKAFLNGDTIDCAPWKCYDEGYNAVTTLPADSFSEVAVNLSAFTPDVCLNNVTFKSRASGQSVTSQLKDTTGPQPFPFCGGLEVTKYIDVDESGTNNAGDVTSDTGDPAVDGDSDLAGWTFSVYGPTAAEPDLTDDTTWGALVCTDTTDDDGTMGDCSGQLSTLAPGWYVVVEDDAGKNLPTDASVPTVNTDPGTTAVAKKVELVLGGDSSLEFGNTCTIKKTFSVSGVPSGTSGLLVWYDTDLNDDGISADVTYLTPSASTPSTTFVADAAERFRDGDAIEWGYGIDHTGDGDLEDAGDDVELGGDETFSAIDDGYPDCARVNPTTFAPPTLNIKKFKDITADGGTADDTQGLGGWEFKLYRDDGDGTFDDSSDTLVETLTTATVTDAVAGTTLGEADSTVELAPGRYFVLETQKADWVATDPSPDANGDVVRTIFLNLSENGSVSFYNAPEIDFTVAVNHPTTHTQTDSITCTKTAGTGSGSVSDGDATADGFSSGDQLVGTFQCTIVVSDP